MIFLFLLDLPAFRTSQVVTGIVLMSVMAKLTLLLEVTLMVVLSLIRR